MKYLSPMTMILPSALHTIYLGWVEHLIHWVTSFLEQHSSNDKYNLLLVMIPSYPGFARFTKPYSQVTQCSRKKRKALWRIIIPVFPATQFNRFASQWIHFTEALLCIENLLFFHLMAQYRYHSEAII